MLDVVLDFLKTTLPLWAFVLAFFLLFIVSLFSEKIKTILVSYALHPRCRTAIWITIAVPLILMGIKAVCEDIFIPLLLISCLLIFALWLFAFVCTPLFFIIRRIYAHHYNKGRAVECFKSLEHWRWCAFTKKDKITYAHLISSYCCILHTHEKAHKAFQRISDNWLFAKELHEYNIWRAYHLWELGANRSALQLLKDINDPTAQSLCSVMEEESGESVKSFDTIRLSIDQAKINNIQPRKAAMLYNNYARVSALKGNLIQAELYFLDALRMLKKCKDIYLSVTVYENLIFNSLRQDKKELAERYLSEFEELENRVNSKYLHIEYINLKLKYASQNKMIREIKELICSVIEEAQTLSDKEHISLLVSAGRIAYNFKILSDDIFKQLNNCYHLITSEVPCLRFQYNKELFFVLNGYANFQSQYALSLKNKVSDYFSQSALEDYEAYLKTIPEFSVRERIEWLKNKLFLTNTIDHKCDFDKTESVFSQIWDTCFENGLWFQGVRTQIDFLNESFAPYNVVNPAALIPQSKYSNRIFCVYNEICKNIEPYDKDPRFADMWIQLGTYSICLGQPDAARNFIKRFDDLNVSVEHFSDYIQDQYHWSKNLLTGV